MDTVKWSIPGQAKATILLPPAELNSVFIFNVTPARNHVSAVRGAVNSNVLPDVVDVEHFDHILKKLQVANRLIHIDMVHQQKSFDAQIAFSFVGGEKTQGEVVPFTTNANGITRVSVIAELV